MHELISIPGLSFELFKFRGLLTYTFARNGRPSKQYVLSNDDFGDPDGSENSDTGHPQALEFGVDISAVGIRLRLLKNEGLLRMDFEGNDGGSANWSFEGLHAEVKLPMCASASTQTHINGDKCMMCGHETAKLTAMHDKDTQTEVASNQEMGTQTKVIHTANVGFTAGPGIQSAVDIFRQELEVHSPTIAQKQDISTQTDTTVETDTTDSTKSDNITTCRENPVLKRKASPQPDTATPLSKRAKSRHNSLPWPRRINMECWREKPTSKGDLGRLIIDLEKATVYYESRYGKVYARTSELKQVDIRAPDIAVIYHANERGHDRASRILELSRPGRKGLYHSLISLHCNGPKWSTWYMSDTLPRERIFITDPEIVIDAIVHCIDRTSGREAVHDPETDHQLAQEMKGFTETRKAPTSIWGLEHKEHVDAEWMAVEFERRQMAKRKAKIYEPGKIGAEIEIPY